MAWNPSQPSFRPTLDHALNSRLVLPEHDRIAIEKGISLRKNQGRWLCRQHRFPPLHILAIDFGKLLVVGPTAFHVSGTSEHVQV